MDRIKQLDFKLIAGLAGAAGILLTLIVFGRQYTSECRKAGGEFQQCWDRGLAISGMGPGGALSAGAVLGYIVGTAGKEKEKEEKYREGYWTLNPELHKDDQP